MLALADPDLDDGPRTDRSATARMCVVTRRVRPIDELIRFVVAPTGEAIPDLKRKLPGRGLWVSASHEAVTQAARRNLFAKGFKKNVRAPATLADDTARLMLRGVVEALAIAAKAGQVVSGFTRVEDALRQRQAAVLIHASDGAADGIRKLDGMVRRDGAVFPVVTVLTSDELDLALGRSNVIHAALLAGPAGKTFLSRSQTLVRYRMADDGKTGADAAAGNPAATHAGIAREP